MKSSHVSSLEAEVHEKMMQCKRTMSYFVLLLGIKKLNYFIPDWFSLYLITDFQLIKGNGYKTGLSVHE